MIDLHCHLLPRIDDGPSDVAASVSLASLQVQAGVDVVAFTPHVDWTWPNTARSIERIASESVPLIRRSVPGLRIISGAEIALTKAIALTSAELKDLSLARGSWALIESPHSGSLDVPLLISQIRAKGRRVVLAHPERSPAAMRHIDGIEELVRAGNLLLQVTAGSLTGSFGRSARAAAHALLARGLIHVLASDAHDHEVRRPGLLAGAAAAGIPQQTVDWMTRSVPASIISGDPIPPRPEQPPRHRRWVRRRHQRSSAGDAS
jgi:protein-tyrosine phosphatase